jgi:hypothetical protein
MIRLFDLLFESPASNYQIYCDMDGVLTDFESRFKTLTGKTIEAYESENGKSSIWAPIETAGVAFWNGMPWMPDGEQLWDGIADLKPIILSAPSRHESSRIGKRLWAKRNMPGTKIILTPAQYKQRYAAPYHVLIDDKPENIQQWQAKGGVGILHTSAKNSLNELQKVLNHGDLKSSLDAR